MANSSSLSVFQTLKKFSATQSDDFSSWLRGFETCCVIAGKSEKDLIKGQLLITCLTGSALAVAERLEEEKQTAQNFTEIKAKLESVYSSEADKQLSQEKFEGRHLEIGETEEELMNSLVKLHRAANPDGSDEDLKKKVRKENFLVGYRRS